MAKVPLVSVVLPTYNHLSYLPAAVDSILGQSFADFELIIVDDGATDGTAAWLDGLTDSRVRVIHQDNQGTAKAMNRGLSEARGELLTWVSSDNIYLDWFLAAHVAALDHHPEAALAYSSFYTIDAAGAPQAFVAGTHLTHLNLLFGNNDGGNAAFLYRRSCQDAVGPYNETLPLVTDTDMWCRMLANHEAVYVVEPTCLYRDHPGAQSSSKAAQLREELKAFVSANLFGGRLDLDRLYRGADTPDMKALALADLGARFLRQVAAPRPAADCYRLALSMAPLDMAADLTCALARVAAGTPEQVAAEVRETAAANPRLGPDHAVRLAELARAFRTAAPDGGCSPLLTPGPTLFELNSRKQRTCFSYFGQRAREAMAAGPVALRR